MPIYFPTYFYLCLVLPNYLPTYLPICPAYIPTYSYLYLLVCAQGAHYTCAAGGGLEYGNTCDAGCGKCQNIYSVEEVGECVQTGSSPNGSVWFMMLDTLNCP